MRSSCLFCRLLLLTVALVGAGVFGWFFVHGNVRTADDGRTAVVLSPGERDLVLKEMRGFLEAVQAITEAVSENDMAGAAEAARRVGRVDMKNLPAGLLVKLPVELKRLGLDTHRAFLQLARDIEGGMRKDDVLKRMGEIMLNCTSCHAGYRFEPETWGQS